MFLVKLTLAIYLWPCRGDCFGNLIALMGEIFKMIHQFWNMNEENRSVINALIRQKHFWNTTLFPILFESNFFLIQIFVDDYIIAGFRWDKVRLSCQTLLFSSCFPKIVWDAVNWCLYKLRFSSFYTDVMVFKS